VFVSYSSKIFLALTTFIFQPSIRVLVMYASVEDVA
jgi:hypothetical protein